MDLKSISADDETWAQFPVKLWGLDPLFWSNVKLFIGQALALPAYPDLPGTQRLYSHPVSKFEILGYVVGVKR